MTILDETNRVIDHILFIGDTHGDNINIPHHVEKQTKIPQQEPKALIHVGDFGVGFQSYDTEMHLLDSLNTKLIEHNTTMYVVRGNHDNPEWFNGEFVFSNLVFLKDHTVLEFQRMGKILMRSNAPRYTVMVDQLVSTDPTEQKEEVIGKKKDSKN